MEKSKLSLGYRGIDKILLEDLVEIAESIYVNSPTANCQVQSVANFNDILKILKEDQVVEFIALMNLKRLLLVNVETKKNYKKLIKSIESTDSGLSNIINSIEYKFKNKLQYTLLISTRTLL